MSGTPIHPSSFLLPPSQEGCLAMRLDTTIVQRMDQRMILAPRMIQSMEILQLPIMALQERIQQELQENPVLELKDSTAEDQPTAEEDSETPPDPEVKENDDGDREKEQAIEETGDNTIDFERVDALNRDSQDHFNENN